MSKLYVNTIYPQSGNWVAVSGSLDVSGTITAYQFDTIVEGSTTYLGSTSFGNDSTDLHQYTGSLELTGSGITITGAEAGAATLTFKADQGDDAADTTTVSVADGGDFTVDCAADIMLDADGGEIFFEDGGSQQGVLKMDTSNKFILSSSVPTNDLYLMSGRDIALEADGGDVFITVADANAAGAGVGNAASQTMYVAKVNGEIVTTILIDIQGLVNDGAASDVIGDSGESAAYITRITSAVNGVVYKAEMACVEEPTTCTADIDLVASSAALAEGATASGAANYTSIIAPGAAYEPGTCRYTASGTDLIDVTEQSSYIYLVHGGSGASGADTYGAGKFIIKFYGVSF